MLASIQQANDKGLPVGTVVGSLDVNALHPSLDIDLTARVKANTYMEHSYEIINVEYNANSDQHIPGGPNRQRTFRIMQHRETQKRTKTAHRKLRYPQ